MKRMSRLFVMLVLLAPLAACGGGGGRPDPIAGPYALLSAGTAPGQLLELSSGFEISCKPQPNIWPFDFAAAGDSQRYCASRSPSKSVCE